MESKHLIFISDHYHLYSVLNCEIHEYDAIWNDEAGKCRFCGTQDPNLFKNKSHTIPYALGNMFVLSPFECDNCNRVFKKYDDSLINFVGQIRAYLNPEMGGKKRRLPSFEIRESKGKIVQTGKATVTYDPDKKIIKDSEDGKTTLQTLRKYPYYPDRVYKALLKIFLSVIDYPTFLSYKNSLEYLMNDVINEKIESHGKIVMDEFETNDVFFEPPRVYIFKKLNDDLDVSEYAMAFCFANKVFYFFPYKNNDNVKHFLPEIKLTFHVQGNQGLIPKHQTSIVNLNGKEKITEDIETIGIEVISEPVVKTFNDEEHRELLKILGIE